MYVIHIYIYEILLDLSSTPRRYCRNIAKETVSEDTAGGFITAAKSLFFSVYCSALVIVVRDTVTFICSSKKVHMTVTKQSPMFKDTVSPV